MEKLDPCLIGERIREKRLEHGLTQKKMSEILGISEVFYGRIERGERMVSVYLAATVKIKFNISFDYLFFGELSNSENEELITEINSVPQDIRKPLGELVKGISKLANELIDDSAKR